MNTSIELSGQELKTALTGLGKVINRSASLPVLQSVRVTRDREGIVTLHATDLDAHVLYQLREPQPGPACDFLAPHEPLGKAARGRLSSLQLVPEEGRTRLRTFVGSTPIEQSVDTVPVKEFPPLPVIDTPAITVDEPFRDALRQAMECCGDDPGRAVLRNVCLDVSDPRAHYLVATDGRHLYCANSFAFDLKEPVLIPEQRFLKWSGFMEAGNGELSVKPASPNGSAWVQIRSGAWTFIARQFEGAYPNWRAVLPKDHDRTVLRLDRLAMETLLAGVPRLPGGDDLCRPVRLETGMGRLHVKARGKNSKDWSVLPVEGVSVDGKPVAVTLNREYLLKALRCGLDTVAIRDELTPLDFSANGKRMIVMPVRTEDPVKPVPATHPQPGPQGGSVEAQPKEEKPMTKNTEPIETQSNGSPVKPVLQQIEQIKETLKGVLRDLNETAVLLRQAEREKKASEKEVESVRATLRSLQRMQL